MKLAKFCRGDLSAQGIVDGDRVQVVGAWHAGNPLERTFDLPGMSRDEIASKARGGESVALIEVKLLPPIGPHSKVICVGFNYKSHVAETLTDLPLHPILFTKYPDAFVGNDEPILRPLASSSFDFEGEIAVVIGKTGRHISHADAMTHVCGYTVAMDGSLRDFQKHSLAVGKNFWRSSSLGPWISTADEIPDPAQLNLTTRLNGVEMQSSSADLMVYDISTLIAYISQWTPLSPGDVIATGTPAGVGSRRTPPLWMKQGDVLEVTVDRVGSLRNPVEDETAHSLRESAA